MLAQRRTGGEHAEQPAPQPGQLPQRLGQLGTGSCDDAAQAFGCLVWVGRVAQRVEQRETVVEGLALVVEQAEPVGTELADAPRRVDEPHPGQPRRRARAPRVRRGGHGVHLRRWLFGCPGRLTDPTVVTAGMGQRARSRWRSLPADPSGSSCQARAAAKRCATGCQVAASGAARTRSATVSGSRPTARAGSASLEAQFATVSGEASRWNCTPHAHGAEPKRLVAVGGGGRQQLGVGRQVRHRVEMPLHRRDTPPQRAEQRVVGGVDLEPCAPRAPGPAPDAPAPRSRPRAAAPQGTPRG